MQNPLVAENRNWLKKGKKKLCIESSSLSAPMAMMDMGKKNKILAKKMNISDFLLNILSNYAAYLPTVSPMLKKRTMRMTVQL